VRVGVTTPLPHERVRGAGSRIGYARRGGSGVVIDARCTALLCDIEWTLAAYDRLGTVRMRGNRLQIPRRSTTTRPVTASSTCIVAGSDTKRVCKAMDRPDLMPIAVRPPRRPCGLGDEINGIVAAWTATLGATDIEARCGARRRYRRPARRPTSSPTRMQYRHDLPRSTAVIGPVRQQAPLRVVGTEPTPPIASPSPGIQARCSVHSAFCDGRADGFAAKGVV
jgi:hypothetical protein